MSKYLFLLVALFFSSNANAQNLSTDINSVANFDLADNNPKNE